MAPRGRVAIWNEEEEKKESKRADIISYLQTMGVSK